MAIMSAFVKKYVSGYHKPGGIGELLVVALPMVVSTACDGLMVFIDRMFLAHVSTTQMNAAMGGGTTIQVLIFFFMGLVGYSNALVSQYFGAGEKQKTTLVAFQTLLVVLVAYPVIVMLKPFAFMFFSLIHLPPGQVSYQVTFMNILAWGSVFGLARYALSCYFTGIGKTRVVMYATLVSLAVNVLLDYILIFGTCGVAPMGIMGAAIATVSGSACGLCFLVWFYFNHQNRTDFGVLQSFRFRWDIMKKLLFYGYPAGVEMLCNFLALTLMILLFHSQGEVVATASTIMFSWDMMTFIPLLGIEIAVTSLVGRYMGAGRPQVAHRAAISGFKTGVFFSMVMLVVFVVFPYQLVVVFRPQVAQSDFLLAVPLAVSMIRIASFYILAEAVMVSLVGALRGAGDTHFTMLASVTLHWLMVAVLYVSFNVFHLHVITAWIIIVVAFLLFCLVLYARFSTGKWKKINILNN